MRKLVTAGIVPLLAIGLGVQVAEASLVWCESDPSFTVTSKSGQAITLHLTIYGAGLENAQAVAAGGITQISQKPTSAGQAVALIAHTPNGPNGTFLIRYVVSTGTFGSGTVLASQDSQSGTDQKIKFVFG